VQWLITVGKSLLEWGRQASYGGKWTTLVTKAILFILTLVFVAVGNTSRLSLLVYPENSQPAAGTQVPWHPQVGWFILFGVTAVWLAVAFGVTWTRFRSLEIAKNLVRDMYYPIYHLLITNRAFTGVEVPVYAVAIADDNRVLPGVLSFHKIELARRNHDSLTRPTLAKAMPYRVNVLRSTGANVYEDGGAWISNFGILELGSSHPVTIGAVSSVRRNKLWVQIGIGEPEKNTRWFSVMAGPTSDQLTVEPGTPPFINSQPSLTSSPRTRSKRGLAALPKP
jgi:hypothetical protein